MHPHFFVVDCAALSNVVIASADPRNADCSSCSAALRALLDCRGKLSASRPSESMAFPSVVDIGTRSTRAVVASHDAIRRTGQVDQKASFVMASAICTRRQCASGSGSLHSKAVP